MAPLSAIENIYSSHPLVTKIFIWLILCHRRGHIVAFCWVPAHVSVSERANEVAKASSLRPALACPLPFRDLFPSIRSAIHEAWQERWENAMATTKIGRSQPGLCALGLLPLLEDVDMRQQ